MAHSAEQMKTRILNDRLKRARKARAWRIRFTKLAKAGVTQKEFCDYYRFNMFMLSRYMNQDIEVIKKPKGAVKIRLASWGRIAEIDNALNHMENEILNG